MKNKDKFYENRPKWGKNSPKQPILRKNGKIQQTYSFAEILDFSRKWGILGQIEAILGIISLNYSRFYLYLRKIFKNLLANIANNLQKFLKNGRKWAKNGQNQRFSAISYSYALIQISFFPPIA